MSGFEEFGKSIRDAAASVAEGARSIGNEFADGVSSVTDDFRRNRSFSQTGSDLFLSGAVTSHGGNLSMSDGTSIWITRRDSMLGHLKESDIAQTSWEPFASTDDPCSRELVVHRAMMHGYAQHGSLKAGEFTVAVAHAHTRSTIFRSLISDRIVPIDSEGLYVLGDQPVVVVSPQTTIGSQEVADLLGQAAYTGARIVVVKGHGPFAVAPTIEQAFQLISVLEASCDILGRMDAYRGHTGVQG